MTIKVPDQATQLGLTGYGRTQETNSEVREDTNNAAGAKPSSSGTEDRVTVTAGARAVHHVLSVVNNQPIVDLHRVEDLRKDIARGAYNTDPQRVADKFMMFERALSA